MRGLTPARGSWTLLADPRVEHFFLIASELIPSFLHCKRQYSYFHRCTVDMAPEGISYGGHKGQSGATERARFRKHGRWPREKMSWRSPRVGRSLQPVAFVGLCPAGLTPVASPLVPSLLSGYCTYRWTSPSAYNPSFGRHGTHRMGTHLSQRRSLALSRDLAPWTSLFVLTLHLANFLAR